MEERLDTAGRGARRGDRAGRERPQAVAYRPPGSPPSQRLVRLPRPDRSRQDRAGRGARGVHVRRREGHGPARHVRVPGAPHRLPAGRLSSRLRRLRGGGPLTEAVRRRPYSVILLDEIEKAQPEVSSAAPDPGRRAPDRRPGPTVDFRNTVIIMTSNVRSTKTSATGSAGAPAGSTRSRSSSRSRERDRRHRRASAPATEGAAGRARAEPPVTDAAKEAVAEVVGSDVWGAAAQPGDQRLIENHWPSGWPGGRLRSRRHGSR